MSRSVPSTAAASARTPSSGSNAMTAMGVKSSARCTSVSPAWATTLARPHSTPARTPAHSSWRWDKSAPTHAASASRASAWQARARTPSSASSNARQSSSVATELLMRPRATTALLRTRASESFSMGSKERARSSGVRPSSGRTAVSSVSAMGPLSVRQSHTHAPYQSGAPPAHSQAAPRNLSLKHRT